MKITRFICGLLAAMMIIGAPAAASGLPSDETGSDAGQSTAAAAAGQSASHAPVDVTGISSYPEKPDVSADSIILLETNSNTILYSKNATEKRFPASITKIMTALLVIENCSLDEVVTFSYRATHELEPGSSSIARTDGEQMTVRDCLYCMLVASANEVAQALAEHVAGSFEAFAELMNKRAQELGCVNTHFTNPSGLHSEEHYTCCLDMALIMAEAISNPVFVEIDSTTSYTVPATNKHSESFGVAMKHELLRGSGKYKYAICGKTGYTSKSGFTLVTYAAKDGLDLVCVTLGCDDSSERATSTKRLFDYGFENFSVYNISEADPSMSAGSSGSGFLSSDLLSLAIPSDSCIVLPAGIAFQDLTSSLSWNSEAGIDGEIARVNYYYGQELAGSSPLTIDTSSSDTYAFLTDGTYSGSVAESEEEDSRSSALRLIIIAVVSVLALAVLAMLGFRFINGRTRRRKRRGARVSKNIRRYR